VKKNNPALVIIFLTIFIDLLGFGVIIPLMPSFSENVLHISESMIGLIAGIFSLMQFIFTPIWGSLSDRYGRKPILVMSLFGSVISNLMLAFVFSGMITSVYLLIIARAFAGVFAANISAAQAVISDVTSPEERTKGMGLIGAAFGLGFVFGPAVGGLLSKNFGYDVPVYVAAFLSFCALVLCLTVFKESLPKEIQEKNKAEGGKYKKLDFKLMWDVVKHPAVGKYIIIMFIIIFAFSNIFGTFQLFAERDEGFNMSQEEVGYLFSLLGIVGALVQLFLIKRFQKAFGEQNTLIFGVFICIFGLGYIGFSPTILLLLLSLTVLALGNSLSNTVIMSLISQNTSPREQGTILGVSQSLGSLARFLGPVWGGLVYEKLGYRFPFITGGVFMFIVTVYCVMKIKRSR
jgi:MFS family permease